MQALIATAIAAPALPLGPFEAAAASIGAGEVDPRAALLEPPDGRVYHGTSPHVTEVDDYIWSLDDPHTLPAVEGMHGGVPGTRPASLEILDGTPDGPVLASAEALVSGEALVPGGFRVPQWVDFTFSPPVSLVPGSLVYLYLHVEGRAEWGFADGDVYPAGDNYITCRSGSPTLPRNIAETWLLDLMFVTFAPASTSPTEPGDRDGDGIPDDRDPDMVGDVVRELPEAAFAARGHRTAFLSRLAAMEDRVAAGDDARAVEELRNLRRRVDGCGSAADNND